MVEVLVTEEFKRWYEELDENDSSAVYVSVGLLEARGTSLGFPYSSAIVGARHALRELRIKSGKKQLRVFYAFDPARNAVLLIGGVKTGKKSFYNKFVSKAEKLWEEYLRDFMPKVES